MRLALLGLALVGCSSRPPAQQPAPASASGTCAGPRWKTLIAPFDTAVVPQANVAGAEKLVAAELVKRDPCFLVLDHDEAMAHKDDPDRCAPGNPLRDQFDCDGPTKSGLMLGAQYVVMTTVLSEDFSIPRMSLMVKLVAVESNKMLGGDEIQGIGADLVRQIAQHLSEWRNKSMSQPASQ